MYLTKLRQVHSRALCCCHQATPTLVGFNDWERLLGDVALAQIRSNVKNTCRNFKHLVGRKLEAQDLQNEPLGFFGWKVEMFGVCFYY